MFSRCEDFLHTNSAPGCRAIDLSWPGWGFEAREEHTREAPDLSIVKAHCVV
jgi:hypothetical protein